MPEPINEIRILRIINRLNIGGPTYNATFLSKFLPAPFKTLLVAGQKEDNEASSEFILEKYDVKAHKIKDMVRTPGIWGDLKSLLQIIKLIQEYKPHIVHTHAAKAGILGRIAAFICRTPIIIHTFHGHTFEGYFSKTISKIVILIERCLALITTKIIAISEVQKLDLSSKFNVCRATKIQVIPLGLDLNPFLNPDIQARPVFRKQWGIEENTLALGIVGRLVPIKNHKLFLDSFQYWKANSNQAIKAIIIGDGELKEDLINHCQLLNLKVYSGEPNENLHSADVVFTSWITDIANALPGLDMLCLSSDNEGTPVSLIEAQAAGLTILTTDVGGIKDCTLPGISAILIEKNNLKEYSEQGLELIDNSEKRIHLSNGARDFIENHYHYTRLIKDFKELYTQLLQQKSIL